MITFDQILPITTDVLLAHRDVIAKLEWLLVNRDLNGRVRLIVPESAASVLGFQEQLEAMYRELAERIKPHAYSAGSGILYEVSREEACQGASAFPLGEVDKTWLVDRLATESRWESIAEVTPGAPRVVFFSIKGGVGRSTALAASAWSLAMQGKRVLVLDLDLESPGLSSALLPPERQPQFGIADWLVEDLVDNGDTLLVDIYGTSDLPTSGSIYLVPAHGREIGEYVSKLGRCWMPKRNDQGMLESWSMRLNRLVDRLEAIHQPDVILIDSRAGIDEVAAACVTDLGAHTVLMFAIQGQQTWTGYRALFSHWRQRGVITEIRNRLQLVAGLVPDDERRLEYLTALRSDSYALFVDTYDKVEPGEISDRNFEEDDDDAPHSPLAIRWNRGWYGLLSLQQRMVHVDQTEVKAVFGNLLDFLGARGPGEVGEMNSQAIRQAILAVPFELDNTGDIPNPGTLHIPPAHRKALTREAVLVIGARGVGKSFWTAALGAPELREQISATVPELLNTTIQIGHAVRPNLRSYPDPNTFNALLCAGHEPYSVWRAVVLRWLAGIADREVPVTSWKETVEWVDQNPEPFAQIVESANQKLFDEEKFGLIVFDALDRTSHDWGTMNRIVRDLLRVALWLRDIPRVRAKIFLRPDQMERTVTSFPDASKITSTSVNLTWDRHDLHAMLWQRLINAPGTYGACLRAVVTSVLPPSEALTDHGTYWALPPVLMSDSPYQRRLFEALAGDKMGKDARRGMPYVWSAGHLADGHGWTSPRSFLAAIVGAAEDSAQRYAEYPLALHYESLKRGIQKASQIRVEQVAEDDPWVPAAMQPLRGINVPCDFEMISNAWTEAFPGGAGAIPSDRLPPQHAESWDGVRKDLERLGILVTREDGRIDMPDLYRVGFGLGRRGGVAPRKRS